MKENRKIMFLFFILLIFSLNSLLLNNFSTNQNSSINDKTFNNNDNKQIFEENELNTQYLTLDNIYGGNGAPWNVTHYANKTSYNLPIEFTNNSYDSSQGVEMPENWEDWEAYKISANIDNLYDTRNWCNGTYHFGDDNDYQNPQTNDSATIPRISNNEFQNWVFGESDQGGYNNPTSGNYIDSASDSPVNSLGHDCVELRINGNDPPGGEVRYWYDAQDRCWWESSFNIPRGNLIDCTFYFEINPYHLVDSNTFEIVIYLNNVYIYSYGVFELEQEMGEQFWINRSIPFNTWLNTTDVFTNNILNDSAIDVRITLRHNMAGTVGYGLEDGENINYQQVLIDNVKLITKAEAVPTDLNLKMNSSEVNDITGQWGKGIKIQPDLNLQSEKIFIEFSSNQIENLSLFEDNGKLISYKIEFKADINLYAIQNNPESYYDTEPEAIGSNFEVSNESNIVEWDCYAYVNVSSGFAESKMTLKFPIDYNITAVYDASAPTINISASSIVDHSIDGQLSITSDSSIGLSNGYWGFQARSPNYCSQLSLYNNDTGIWASNTTYMSGDYMNITAKVDDPLIIKDYINDTLAILRIRFPDGSYWTENNQIKSPDTSGYISFEPIHIPNTIGSNYQAGDYEAIITWNNSYNNYDFNESGIISKRFTVVHDSEFKTIDNIYYFDEVLEDENIIVKFSFKDLLDDTPIKDANVYAINDTGQTQNLTKPSDGIYWLIYDASQAALGNNSLTIFANHSYYANQKINISIYVVQETMYYIQDDFITDVSYNSNFTVEFNYTLISSGNGISTNPTTDWHPGDCSFEEISPDGNYILECNTTSYIAGDLIIFSIYLSEYTYQSQNLTISVIIDELGTFINYYVNNLPPPIDKKYTIEVDEYINITVNFTSIYGDFLSNANVVLKGGGTFDENANFKFYNLTIFAGDLDQGITTLEITANKTNYVKKEVKLFIEVIERKAYYNIFLNGVNETLNPFISVKMGSTINITAKYNDNKTKSHISNASIFFTLDSIDYNLTEILSYQQYSRILDSNILNIGIKTLELKIRKNNFQWFNIKLVIEVKKLQTDISTEDDEDIYEIDSGDDITITIILRDLDNNIRISGAIVSYDWKHGDGDFDEKGNGEYEVTLEDIPKGTYTITITVVESSNIYNFEEYEITIKSVTTEEDTLLWQILLLAAIIIGTAFAAYIVYYQRVLRFPKPVRKVRKYRRTLKKKSAPKTDIISREKAFKDIYSEELGKGTKQIKIKTKKEKLKSQLSNMKKSLKTLDAKSPQETATKETKKKEVTDNKISKNKLESKKKATDGEELK